MKKYKFRLAAYTDSAGKTNPEAPHNGNEDNMFVCADLSSKSQETLFSIDKEEALSKGGCLLVVADGMGGMNAGEVASEIAINVVKESFSPDAIQSAVFESTKTRTRFLEGIVVRADSAIKRHAEQHPECEGMGSTIIMAWLYEGQVTVTWCGDSRAYLYRPSVGLKQISKDHSYVQDLVDEGKITMDEAFDHPYNNVITRSLGDAAHKARPDSVTVPVFRGDIIMVNSDGLSGVLRDAELESIISENCQTMSSCRAALWHAAERADWYDNVTAILCEITEGTEYSPALDSIEEKDLNKSFFNIKISKKGLKLTLAVLGAILIGAIIFLTTRSCHKETLEESPIIEESAVIEETTGEDPVLAPASEPESQPRRAQPSDKNSIKETIASKPEEAETDTVNQAVSGNSKPEDIRRRLTPADNPNSNPLDNGKPSQKKEGTTEGTKDRPKLTPVQDMENPTKNLPKADTSKISI
ncbi:MAG: serine/threonine-protein phosphatase [Bacteroidales bacterium]|nr:serine/threonine-protein phosphatase [Bacteroidales bacterium]